MTQLWTLLLKDFNLNMTCFYNRYPQSCHSKQPSSPFLLQAVLLRIPQRMLGILNSCTLSWHCWCCCQPSPAHCYSSSKQLDSEKWSQGTWTSITVCLSLKTSEMKPSSLFNLCSEIVVTPLHLIDLHSISLHCFFSSLFHSFRGATSTHPVCHRPW